MKTARFSLFLSLVAAAVMTRCAPGPRDSLLYIGCALDTALVLRFSAPNMADAYDILSPIGPDAFLAYHPISHSLDWVDWSQKDAPLSSRLQLEREGPRGIETVESLHFHHPDTIFLLGSYHLYIVDERGEIRYKTAINREGSDLQGIDFSDFFLHARGKSGTDIYYNALEGSLYLGCKRSRYDQFSIPEHYTAPIAAKLDLRTGEVSLLDLYYPAAFREQSYGLLNRPNLAFFDDRIVYNFKVSSKVYVYDLASRTLATYACPSRYAAEEAQPFRGSTGDPDQLVAHVQASPDYGKLIYDPYNDWYYRNILVPDEARSGKKKQILSIIAPDFTVAKEILVPRQTLTFSGLMPTSAGLLAPVVSEEEEVKQYRRFRLVCE
jgi:hypothetical protein